MGYLSSYFVSTPEMVDKITGREVYFGEVLGKHSEIYGTIEEDDIRLVSDDPEFVEQFDRLIGSSGHNPFRYVHWEEDDGN
jgi:hypothetical protein